MSEARDAKVTTQSLAKGVIAGLIGGLVATAAKTLAERMFPPRTHGESEAREVLGQTVSEHLSGHSISDESREAVGEGIHWAFGAVAGAAYGALAEFYPAATAKDGASFGIALGSLIHEGALPALGISGDHEDETLRERASEFSSYLVYGVVAENVRRVARKLL